MEGATDFAVTTKFLDISLKKLCVFSGKTVEIPSNEVRIALRVLVLRFLTAKLRNPFS